MTFGKKKYVAGMLLLSLPLSPSLLQQRKYAPMSLTSSDKFHSMRISCNTISNTISKTRRRRRRASVSLRNVQSAYLFLFSAPLFCIADENKKRRTVQVQFLKQRVVAGERGGASAEGTVPRDLCGPLRVHVPLWGARRNPTPQRRSRVRL